MPGDGVDDAADRVAAVKQRGRTFDDFDPFHCQDIDRLGVIARFETKPANPIAVLQDEHAVAVEASNYRPRSSRSETSLGDSEFAVERFAERYRTLLCQFDRTEYIN